MTQPKNKSPGGTALPMMTRAAAVARVDEAARTFELVWTTGAKVRRFDWWREEPYDEELVVSAAAVDLSRLNAGAPLLESHGQWSLRSVLGVVEKAWLEGGEGRAVVRFAAAESSPDGDRVFRMVRDQIIRNVSVGYTIRKVERQRPEGGVTLWRVVDWQPFEISLVAVGADPGAGVRAADVPTYPLIITDQPAARAQTKEPAMPDPIETQDPADPAAAPPSDPTRTAPAPVEPAPHAWTPADMAKVQARARAFGLGDGAAIEVMGTARSLEEATDALQAKAATSQTARTQPHHRAAPPAKVNPDTAKRLNPADIYAARRGLKPTGQPSAVG